MARIVFYEKIQDISDEELYQIEELNMKLKDKRFKWRRIKIYVTEETGILEVNERETILEFEDTLVTVKGSFDEISKIIDDALEQEKLLEKEIEEEEENN